MADTIINVHPVAAAALRARLGTAEDEPGEARATTLFVHAAIEVFRARPGSDRKAALERDRWPGHGDDERVPVAITKMGQDELNHFLYHDWEVTGIGFSEFLRRALADPGIAIVFLARIAEANGFGPQLDDPPTA